MIKTIFVFRINLFYILSPNYTIYIHSEGNNILTSLKQRCTQQFTQQNFYLENIIKNKTERVYYVWMNQKGFALNFMSNKNDEEAMFSWILQIGFKCGLFPNIFKNSNGKPVFCSKSVFLFCNLFLSTIWVNDNDTLSKVYRCIFKRMILFQYFSIVLHW